jgi:hypothetical protein
MEILKRLMGRPSIEHQPDDSTAEDAGVESPDWVVTSTPDYVSDAAQASILRDPRFWAGFFGFTLGDEETDLVEATFGITSEEAVSWWNQLSGWYDGVLDDTDGDLERPKTLQLPFGEDRGLDIEIHAGSIYYRVRSADQVENLAAIGPHESTPGLPWADIRRLAVQADRGTQTRPAVSAAAALLLMAPLTRPIPDRAPTDDIDGDLTAALEETGTTLPGRAKALAEVWRTRG